MVHPCSRCGSQGALAEAAPLTGGFCGLCARSIMGRRVELNGLLERLEQPVLVANSQGVIIAGNGSALALLGKAFSEVEGQLGGKVLESAYARLPGGCGKTVHCDGCGIRRAVMNTLKSGRPVVSVRARSYRERGDELLMQDWELTTERLGDLVLLQLNRC